MTELREQNLTGPSFERVSLRGSAFTQMRLPNVIVNGVDIAPHAERDLTSLESEN